MALFRGLNENWKNLMNDGTLLRSEPDHEGVGGTMREGRWKGKDFECRQKASRIIALSLAIDPCWL